MRILFIQKIPFPDKLWIKKKKAFKASEEAYQSFKSKKQEVVYKITDVYYEYLYLEKAIILTKENMRLLSNFEAVVQSKYKSALANNQDL